MSDAEQIIKSAIALGKRLEAKKGLSTNQGGIPHPEFYEQKHVDLWLKKLRPTHPVDGEIDNQIENILDDFGHDVVNNPESSRRSLQAKPKRLLKELHNTHPQNWRSQ